MMRIHGMILDKKQNQSIVISSESRPGKTESTNNHLRRIMYLAAAKKQQILQYSTTENCAIQSCIRSFFFFFFFGNAITKINYKLIHLIFGKLIEI
jgi:myosin heavy subunit